MSHLIEPKGVMEYSARDTEGTRVAERKHAMAGLLVRRERWGLSVRGRLIVGTLIITVVVLAIGYANAFLAVTDPVDTNILVVEGWLPNYALEESIAKFRSKPHRLVITVGCEILTGVNVEPGDNQATYAAKRLQWLGLQPEFIRAAPSSVKYRDRTYASALALKQWFQTDDRSVKAFDLVTLGPHARRSRLLFEEAFEGKVQVGIISIENKEYDPVHWWRYSEGVKEVISEGVAYMYARIFFRPNSKSIERPAT